MASIRYDMEVIKVVQRIADYKKEACQESIAKDLKRDIRSST